MNPFYVIAKLNLDILQRIDLVLVALGVKGVARIDIYASNESPENVKSILSSVGLCFEALKTCGDPNHLCGLAVASNKENLHTFMWHYSFGYMQKINSLADPLFFPLSENEKFCSAMGRIRGVCPELFAEAILVDLSKNQAA